MAIKEVIVYEADDGSRWQTSKDAILRNHEIELVSHAMMRLPRPVLKHGTCWQHSLADVLNTKRDLLDLSRPKIPKWFEDNDPDALNMLHGCPEPICRMLDGGGPLSMAWNRMMCIDKQGREWDQPYFAWYTGATNKEGNQTPVNVPKAH